MQALNQPIAVLGAGSWGTALALVLARNGQTVFLWGHEEKALLKMRETRVNATYLPGYELPDNIQIETELEKALEFVQDVLLVVPSYAFRDVLKRAKPFLHEQVRLVWGCKGLDPETCKTLDEVVFQELGEATSVAVISGPSFAVEVAGELPTAVTLASNNEVFSQELISRFRRPTFRLYQTTDLLGVELCGVYKNVLAIATGLSDGLKLGADARSALITRGVAELSRFIVARGGNKETLLGLAGIGDIILTCTTDASRNRRLGLLVGRDKSVKEALQEIGQVVEGHINTEQLYRLAQQYKIDMPIATQVYQVLYQNKSPKLAAETLLSRDGQDKWE